MNFINFNNIILIDAIEFPDEDVYKLVSPFDGKYGIVIIYDFSNKNLPLFAEQCLKVYNDMFTSCLYMEPNTRNKIENLFGKDTDFYYSYNKDTKYRSISGFDISVSKSSIEGWDKAHMKCQLFWNTSTAFELIKDSMNVKEYYKWAKNCKQATSIYVKDAEMASLCKERPFKITLCRNDDFSWSRVYETELECINALEKLKSTGFDFVHSQMK